MTLIETMILVGVVAVALAAVSQSIDYQQKYTAHLNDKLASLDVQRNVASVLDSTGVCSFMINNPPLPAFNPVNVESLAPTSFAAIPSSAAAGALPAILGDGTTAVSPLSPKLAVQSIRLRDIACASLPCTPDSNQFKAVLELQFVGASGGPLPPVTLPVGLTSTGTSGSQTFSACNFSSTSGGGGSRPPATITRDIQTSVVESCAGGLPNCPSASQPADAQCSAGFKLTSCGYKLTTYPWPYVSNGLAGGYDTVHANSPELMEMRAGEVCRVTAGTNPGCGVCLRAEAICLRVQ